MSINYVIDKYFSVVVALYIEFRLIIMNVKILWTFVKCYTSIPGYGESTTTTRRYKCKATK